MDGKRVLSLQAIKTMPVAPTPSPAELATSKMGMLMDVELVVKVRFGGRRMLLKDILDLCAGASWNWIKRCRSRSICCWTEN